VSDESAEVRSTCTIWSRSLPAVRAGAVHDDLDQIVQVDLTSALSSLTPAAQGYHVALTAEVAEPNGRTVTKHKVFWVEPCESTVAPPAEETPDEETPDEETPDEETPDEETPDEETPQEDTPGGSNGVQQTVDENGGGSSTVVFGAQASVQNSQNSQGAPAAEQPAAAANAQVPTAVEAGLAGDQWSRSVLPLLAVLFGLGTAFVALARRRSRG